MPTLARALFALPPPTSVYIHLPFCAQKCAYCAFPVVVSSSPPAHASYVDVLAREITAFFSRRPKSPPLHTVYLGGGTPSLLDPSLLDKLLATLRHHVPLHANAEVTAEMDPATFTRHSAQQFARLGVNRASVGAQSFDDHLLAACRRIHTSSDIPIAVDVLRQAGISNLSLDLISGLPGQTLDSWRRTLHSAISLSPDHISAYDLTLEPGTPFHARFADGSSPLPDEASAASMMSETATTLAYQGFEHYEISNFARRAGSPASFMRSRHNMAYWQNQPFYAFGLGATSYVDGFRFARPRRLGDYRKYVENLEKSVKSAPMDDEHHLEAALYPHAARQSKRERLEDFLINAFRLLVDGVCFARLEREFGTTARLRLEASIQRHPHFQEQGMLEILRNGRRITGVRLSEAGALLENSILSTLMQDAVWRFTPEDESSSVLDRATA